MLARTIATTRWLSALAVPARPLRCSWRGRAAGAGHRSRRLWHRHDFDARADAWRRAAIAPLGRAPRLQESARRRCVSTTFHYGDEAHHRRHQPSQWRGCAVCAAPHRCSTARWWMPHGKPVRRCGMATAWFADPPPRRTRLRRDGAGFRGQRACRSRPTLSLARMASAPTSPVWPEQQHVLRSAPRHRCRLRLFSRTRSGAVTIGGTGQASAPAPSRPMAAGTASSRDAVRTFACRPVARRSAMAAFNAVLREADPGIGGLGRRRRLG